MVKKCCAPFCNLRDSPFNRNEGISFHRFPKDPQRKLLWEQCIKRLNWKSSPFTYVCSRHFEEDMFDRTGQTTRLREHALPTVFNNRLVLQQKTLRCSVPGCPSNSNGTSRITFNFPENVDLRKIWLKRIKRECYEPSIYNGVCILHFPEEFIERKEKVQKSDGSFEWVKKSSPTLMKDVYPCLRLPSESSDSNWSISKCCVPKCTSNHLDTPPIITYGFPSDLELRKKWVQFSGILETDLNSKTSICIQHFAEEFLERVYKINLSNGKVATVPKSIPSLKKDAYPTSYLPFVNKINSKSNKPVKKHENKSKVSHVPNDSARKQAIRSHVDKSIKSNKIKKQKEIIRVRIGPKPKFSPNKVLVKHDPKDIDRDLSKLYESLAVKIMPESADEHSSNLINKRERRKKHVNCLCDENCKGLKERPKDNTFIRNMGCSSAIMVSHRNHQISHKSSLIKSKRKMILNHVKQKNNMKRNIRNIKNLVCNGIEEQYFDSSSQNTDPNFTEPNVKLEPVDTSQIEDNSNLQCNDSFSYVVTSEPPSQMDKISESRIQIKQEPIDPEIDYSATDNGFCFQDWPTSLPSMKVEPMDPEPEIHQIESIVIESQIIPNKDVKIEPEETLNCFAVIKEEVDLFNDSMDHEVLNEDPFLLTEHKCEKCEEAFHRLSDLENHLLMHSIGNNHRCFFCRQIFNHLSDLRTHHLLIHMSSKKFMCSKCGECFHTTSSLGKHLTIHKNSYHKCVLCDRMFNQLLGLKRHISKHIDIC